MTVPKFDLNKIKIIHGKLTDTKTRIRIWDGLKVLSNADFLVS